MFFPHLLHIKASDLVLEIGPGAFPFWRSDYLADKFDQNDHVDLGQYGGKAMDLKGKPLFKMVNGRLPFKDNSFDYIICSHVLEHVPQEDFGLLIYEINRVAKRKYIEFPTPLYDYVYDFSVHTNFVDIVGEQVICLPKEYSGISQMKLYTDYAMQLRKVEKIGLEVGKLPLFGVGKEFYGEASFTIFTSEEEFFNALCKKYQMPIAIKMPGWGFLLKNLLNRNLRRLKGEKSADYFTSKLLNVSSH